MGSARSDAFRRAAGLEARDRSGRLPGRPVEDVAVEPADDGSRSGHRPHPRGARRVSPDRGARRLAGDFAVADIGGTFIEILAPGQNPRTFRDEKITLEVGHADSMPEINESLRGAVPGETRRFRKTFADDFPNEEFRGKTVDYE